MNRKVVALFVGDVSHMVRQFKNVIAVADFVYDPYGLWMVRGAESGC